MNTNLIRALAALALRGRATIEQIAADAGIGYRVAARSMARARDAGAVSCDGYPLVYRVSLAPAPVKPVSRPTPSPRMIEMQAERAAKLQAELVETVQARPNINASQLGAALGCSRFVARDRALRAIEAGRLTSPVRDGKRVHRYRVAVFS